ncbi:DUF3667 domain-containing protein [uncultured Alistipes sp.]|jgi:membrane protein|uniref:DUF3667 domain-containing protein n=1 Tax=uncultured Alistipes sp. TaxID=538949 RepID=UPI0025F21691|nr:DUF3667 domain-containing protein [uncultured Alistipes sp.]
MKKQICPNCNTPVKTPYCPYCGQRYGQAELSWGTLWEGTMSTFIGEGFSGEKGRTERYGMLGTLWQILRHPVHTTTEFISGHRRRYFNPIALLLLLSGFFAFLNMLFGVEVLSYSKIIPNGESNFEQYTKIITDYINSHPAAAMLMGIPFYALTAKWIFRPRKLRYIEFFYIEIFASVVSVAMLCLLAFIPFGNMPIIESVLKTLPSFAVEVIIYHRIFGHNILHTTANMLIVYALASILLFLSLVVVTVIACIIFLLTLYSL